MEANEIVRTYAAFVFRTRADFHAGIGPIDPVPLLLAEARTVAAIVTPVISKRSWYGLQYVMPELTAECDGDPVVALFAWIAIQCAHCLRGARGGRG